MLHRYRDICLRWSNHFLWHLFPKFRFQLFLDKLKLDFVPFLRRYVTENINNEISLRSTDPYSAEIKAWYFVPFKTVLFAKRVFLNVSVEQPQINNNYRSLR